jgi:Tol biopolymer transport system component
VALSVGARLGVYEVVAPIGAGGMGEVYRARDTRLGRDVAIKVLPPDVAADPERLARFEREAQVLASLNHPNIAHIHGVDDSTGTPALVMELVDGPTLAERIAKGPIAIDEALAIARQIAEGLEAAHEQAIIHRDLKPANIKVREDGTVKVLDFGLAKAFEPKQPSELRATQSPTITTPAMVTGAGIILGTAAYMAPEQARGRPADKRSDVWAFGCVLYEMLTRRRAFPGEDVSDTLAAVLRAEPDWAALPQDTPPAVHRLLRRALRKDPRQRLQHPGDARLEIDDAPASAPSDSRTARVRPWAMATAVAVVAALAGGGVIAWLLPTRSNAPALWLEIATPAAIMNQFAVSPDGRAIVYTRSGRQTLVVRPFEGTSHRPIPGTEGAEYPFWSPDGRSIGFFANNKLQRIAIDGGLPQPLANVLTPAGGTWSASDRILYVPSDSGGVFQIPAVGGESQEVTPRQLATRAPQFLPDGRHFLFYVARGNQPQGMYVGELGSVEIRRVLESRSPAVYGAGHLWFVRDGTLVAQAFDPGRTEIGGAATNVADGVGSGLIAPAVSAASDGPIAYRALAGPSRRELIWFDRAGTQLGTAGTDGALASNPNLSPNGQWLALQRTVNENIDLWLIDLRRDTPTRLTDNPGIDSLPVWSPDGNRIAFNSTTGSSSAMMILTVDRTRPPERLPVSVRGGAKIACDWSADGRFLLYKHFDEQTSSSDLWVLPLQDPQTPIGFLTTAYNERDGQFSPDGKWIAYESDEAGSPEIYLQRFPGPGSKLRVSANGGTQVRWRGDGRELFFIAGDERLTAVPVDLRGATPTIGTPAPLFKTKVAPIRSISRQQYVVSADGQRFLILTEPDQQASPLTVVFNWRPAGAR